MHRDQRFLYLGRLIKGSHFRFLDSVVGRLEAEYGGQQALIERSRPGIVYVSRNVLADIAHTPPRTDARLGLFEFFNSRKAWTGTRSIAFGVRLLQRLVKERDLLGYDQRELLSAAEQPLSVELHEPHWRRVEPIIDDGHGDQEQRLGYALCYRIAPGTTHDIIRQEIAYFAPFIGSVATTLGEYVRLLRITWPEGADIPQRQSSEEGRMQLLTPHQLGVPAELHVMAGSIDVVTEYRPKS